MPQLDHHLNHHIEHSVGDLITYGAVARGTGQKSEITTQNYEYARQIIFRIFSI